MPLGSKLQGVIDTLEGPDAIQRGLEELEMWAHGNLMQFKKAKGKVLPWTGTWTGTTPDGNTGQEMK